MLPEIVAFLVATPVDEIIAIRLADKAMDMPVWVLILLAILFGWIVLPKVVAYVGK